MPINTIPMIITIYAPNDIAIKRFDDAITKSDAIKMSLDSTDNFFKLFFMLKKFNVMYVNKSATPKILSIVPKCADE